MTKTDDTVNGDDDDEYSYDSRTRSFDNSYYDGASQYTYSTYGDRTYLTEGSYDSRNSTRDNSTYYTHDDHSDYIQRDLSYASSRSSRGRRSLDDDQSYSTRGDDFSRAASATAASAYTTKYSDDDSASQVTYWTLGNPTAVSCSDTYLTESTPAGFSSFGKKMPMSMSLELDDHKENNMSKANLNSVDSQVSKQRFHSNNRGWNDEKRNGLPEEEIGSEQPQPQQ